MVLRMSQRRRDIMFSVCWLWQWRPLSQSAFSVFSQCCSAPIQLCMKQLHIICICLFPNKLFPLIINPKWSSALCFKWYLQTHRLMVKLYKLEVVYKKCLVMSNVCFFIFCSYTILNYHVLRLTKNMFACQNISFRCVWLSKMGEEDFYLFTVKLCCFFLL